MGMNINPRKPPPLLSPAARIRAVERAAAFRRERALAKDAIKKGEASIFDLINDPRESIRRMRVVELLSSIPGVGRVRADSIMARRKISPTRRIGGLGPLQVIALKGELAVMKVDATPGSLLVMSGPGGVGKSTIAHQLRSDPRFWVSVSVTTRDPRVSEVDGIDYSFITENKFDQMISAGELLEWAEFAGNRYGTPKEPVDRWRSIGKNVLLEIEIAGAMQVRANDPTAILVFITPPSWEELVERLERRGTDSGERRAARLALAREEMLAAGNFDHILVNHNVGQVIEMLVSLATAPNQ